MTSPSRTFATIFGWVYLAVGAIGFALTGFSGFAATEGPVLIFFEINPLHNIVHLLIGAVLVVAGRNSESVARGVVATIASTYLVVGIVGFFILDSAVNILAINQPDNFLHIGTALIGFIVVSLSKNHTESPVAAS